jgi:REP element-mobilizing transposase RayT
MTFLSDKTTRNRLHAYVIGICKNLDSPAIIIDGTEDHIHILLFQSRKQAISDLIREMKCSSTNWARENLDVAKDFKWQSGSGAFSVSQSKIEEVKSYISSQEKHHKRLSFKEEFMKLLERHNVEYDERYVWD